MVINFSDFSLRDRPLLILKNINMVEIQTLGYAFNIAAELHYNETSVLTFELPAYVDGEKTPHYDDVVGMRIVELAGIGQFVLTDPSIDNNGIKEIKECKAYSLEYELTFKKFELEESTYNFYDPLDQDDTILGMIVERCPSWHIGSVSSSLLNKYRTFDVSDDNIYNFMKGTLQEKYRCIFDFDTMSRTINVMSVDELVQTRPVFLSLNNLLKDVKIDEDTENVFTCLEAYGAEDVDIRGVNPIGTNKLYNINYLIDSGHLSDTMVEKWRQWEAQFEDSQEPFYDLVVEQAMQSSSKLAQEAAYVRLDGEMTGLEAIKATYLSELAKNPDAETREHFQELLDQVNQDIAAKQTDINNTKSAISTTEAAIQALATQMQNIRDACQFSAFFDKYVCPYCGGEAERSGGVYVCSECGMTFNSAETELNVLDRCFKESSLEDTSFVASEIVSYNPVTATGHVGAVPVRITNASIVSSTDSAGKTLYTITGGNIVTASVPGVTAKIISASLITRQNNAFILTAYTSAGVIDSEVFSKGNFTLSGSLGSVTGDMHADPDIGGSSYKVGTQITVTPSSAEMYFSTDTSAYTRASVSWDLYKYAKESIRKLAYPAYTFSVTSGNFMAVDEFVSFRKQLHLGEKIYLDLDGDQILEPICTGIKLAFDDLTGLELEFSDTYSGADNAMGLVDLLEESVSMGKSVARKSNGWNAYVDTGASSSVHDFITGALDVTKNKLLSTSDQAVTWDESGIRLRKWADSDHTVYESQQIWMTDRNIMFTDDNWTTAKMALGLLQTDSGDEVYGLVADYIVGKMVAGENLTIANETGNFVIDSSGITINGLNLLIADGDPVDPDVESISLEEYMSETIDPLMSLTVKSGSNLFLDATKVSGAINTSIATMSACVNRMKYDSNGLWLLNSTSPTTASKAVWMNNSGILLANSRTSTVTTDPSYNGSRSLTWNTAITADGIVADYLVGDHLHATFDISAGTPTTSSYSSCPFYVSESGYLSCRDADISGDITADRLYVGGTNIAAKLDNLMEYVTNAGEYDGDLVAEEIEVGGGYGYLYAGDNRAGTTAFEVYGPRGTRLTSSSGYNTYIAGGGDSSNITCWGDGRVTINGPAGVYINGKLFV